MVPALSFGTRMERNRLTIRYVDLRTTQSSFLGPKGTHARGHEFHHSRIISNHYQGNTLYRAVTSTGRSFVEGFRNRNLLASYIHLHFKSNPLIPAFFVKSCWNYSLVRKD